MSPNKTIILTVSPSYISSIRAKIILSWNGTLGTVFGSILSRRSVALIMYLDCGLLLIQQDVQAPMMFLGFLFNFSFVNFSIITIKYYIKFKMKAPSA